MNAPARLKAAESPLAGQDVLILNAYFHPEPTGSAPPITDLARWLAEQGAVTHVATARPSYPKREVFEGYRNGEHDDEVWSGVAVRRVDAFVSPGRGAVGRLRTELSVAGKMVAALVKGDVRRSDRVIVVCPSTFVAAIAPLFRRRGGRLLCIVHDLQSGLAKSLGFGMGGVLIGALRMLERWSFDRSDVLVALSDEMAEELRKLGVKAPVVVIPPQVDVREIQSEPEAAGPPVLLYSGNLGKKQGLDQILALATELQRRGRPERIVIRGEGSERAELKASIDEAGLANVALQDLAPRDKLSEALAEGAIHLAPQNPDGATFALPSKIFSIMAANRPFLATAKPGTPLHRLARESGAGMCAPPYDAEALADAAQALLDNPALRRRMGAAGRAYVENNIDREVVCRAIWYALNRNSSRMAEPLDAAARTVAAMRATPANSNALAPVAVRASGAATSLAVEPRSFATDLDDARFDDPSPEPSVPVREPLRPA